METRRSGRRLRMDPIMRHVTWRFLRLFETPTEATATQQTVSAGWVFLGPPHVMWLAPSRGAGFGPLTPLTAEADPATDSDATAPSPDLSWNYNHNKQQLCGVNNVRMTSSRVCCQR